MKRIRTLGLAAVMALALTAIVGVGSASASWLSSEAENTVLSGTPTSSSILRLHGGQEISCTGMSLSGSLTGTKTANTLETTLGAGASCNLGGTLSVAMNGCKFIFHPGAQTSEKSFGGTVDIGPANCGPVTIKSASCEVTIPSQTGLKATYDNIGSGSTATVNIQVSASGLKHTEKGVICGPSGTFVDGFLTGNWALKGSSGGKQVGIHVIAGSGLYLTGEKSEEVAKKPRFSADAFPVDIAGDQGAKAPLITTPQGEIKCTSGQVIGELWGPATTLLGVMKYAGCTAYALTAEINMKSCYSLYSVANSGPPYTGSQAIACSKEGDAIEIRAIFIGLMCTITIPPQTVGTVTYKNEGEGVGRYVRADTKGTGLKYSVSNVASSVCGKAGTYTDGTYDGGTNLRLG